MALVKANAYGHGLVATAPELMTRGVESLGVANVAEVDEVRAAGVTGPIWIASPCLPTEFDEAVRLSAWPTLCAYAEARLLDRAAQKQGVVAEAHFKVDTGMGRMGLWPDLAAVELKKILTLKHVRVLAIATHFASADSDPALTQRQIKLFAAFRRQFPDLPYHVANSAGCCLYPDPAAEWLRVGLAAYGVPPTPAFRDALRPALTWKTRITQLRELPAGRTISYGATYRLKKPERLATIAVGYGDGYPRALSNQGSVLIKGHRCPIRGRVTMDQVVIDVSKIPPVKIGEEVVLLGTQKGTEITADELAQLTGTVSYEILTGIGARVPRTYRNWLTAIP
jgi:alanine racemase